MASATSTIRHTFSGKCFIKDMLMQMAVRMMLQMRGSRPKKAEDKQGKRKGKNGQEKGPSLRRPTYSGGGLTPTVISQLMKNIGFRKSSRIEVVKA
jgi:hypothetical protein